LSYELAPVVPYFELSALSYELIFFLLTAKLDFNPPVLFPPLTGFIAF
jgi:hypothetical protein